jgi:Flp pilus assembly protein TadD
MEAAPRLPRAVAPIALAAAAVAAHAPALLGGFVFDDHLLVEGSALVRGPFSALWVTTTTTDYWPLTWSTFWVEWRLFGDAAWGYHATNLALHVATALLLWRVLRALEIPGAWLGALLFAVHPVTVESVAWISERKNVLSSVLFLLSLAAWIRLDARGRSRDLVASVLLFAAALLAKASVVMLPVVALGATLRRRGRVDRRALLRSAPLFAVALAGGLVTLWFQRTNAMAASLLPPRGLAERVGGAAWALLSYLQKAFVPVGVGFVYPPWPVGPAEPLFWAPLALLAGAAAVLWRSRSGWGRAPLLGLGYHAAVLLPVLGLVDIAYFAIGPVSNHLHYLALMGPCALGGAGIARLAADPRRAVPLRAAAAALALGLAGTTFARAMEFRDDATLWAAATRDAPDDLYAAWMYSEALAGKGDVAGALAALSRAAEQARDPAVRLRARSLLLLHSGLYPEAVSAAAEAARIRSDLEFEVELGSALARAGRPLESIAVLRPVVARAPASADARYWLASSLTRLGEYPEAAEVLREGVARAPRDARGKEALAVVLARLGRIDEARAALASARGIAPGDPEIEAQVRRWAGGGGGGR